MVLAITCQQNSIDKQLFVEYYANIRQSKTRKYLQKHGRKDHLFYQNFATYLEQGGLTDYLIQEGIGRNLLKCDSSLLRFAA
jgi:hypothetical protein